MLEAVAAVTAGRQGVSPLATTVPPAKPAAVELAAGVGGTAVLTVYTPGVVTLVAAPRPVKETASVSVEPVMPAEPSSNFLVPNWVLAAMRSIVPRALVIWAWLAARALESLTPLLAESPPDCGSGSAGC